jgi:hypothetical protein
MALDKRNGYFVTALSTLRDPIRTSHWRLRFNVPLIKAEIGGTLVPDVNTDDDIAVMVKTASVPKVIINSVESWYMGQKIYFQTNTEYDKETSFNIQETADVRGFRFLGKWSELAHNTDLYQLGSLGTSVIDPNNEMGVNLGSAKFPATANGGKSVVRNSGWLYLELYDYTTGETILRVEYINVWPSSLGGFELAYENPDLAKYSATFTHDYYRIVLPNNGLIV